MKARLVALALVTASAVLGIQHQGRDGAAFITKHEALVNRAYPDPAHGWAVPTICVGHTRTARRGMWLSDRQCLDLLEEDVTGALAGLRSLLGPGALVTQGELLAYTSFVFNLGAPKLRNSTWRKKFLAGDRKGACLELRRWVYSNGQRLRGLERRRSEESLLCLRDL